MSNDSGRPSIHPRALNWRDIFNKDWVNFPELNRYYIRDRPGIAVIFNRIRQLAEAEANGLGAV
jgi:hypothetical protein